MCRIKLFASSPYRAAVTGDFPHHFSAGPPTGLNLFYPGRTYPLPGALQNSGIKPAPPSEYTPLGRRSAFLPPPSLAIDVPLRAYFSEVLIDVNMELRVVPRPLTAAMMARLMPAAINPYSIAVAADWSARNLENIAFIFHPHGRITPGFLPVPDKEL
jgi:hypothetical protein